MAVAAAVGRRPRPSLSTQARAALVTTPGKLRLLSVVVVAAILLVWIADLAAVSQRQRGVTAFRDQGDLVVLAQHVQTELTDADAGAANAFLAGGLEPPDQVARYVDGTTAAADDLAQAASDAGTSGPAGAAIRSLSEQLQTYIGLVATAQADNRQGFPIGAAYLRSASALLHTSVLPAAASLAEISAGRLNQAEDRATGATDVAEVVLTILLLLGLLVVTQGFVTRRTRRALNLGLAAATLVALILAVVVLSDLGSERAAVVTGGEHGYASVARLTAARVLAFQAQGDESEALIARGNGQSDESDLDADVARVKTLVDQATISATAADLSGAQPALSAWQAVDAKIRALDNGGQHDAAVTLALGHATGDSLPAFDVFDASMATAITAEQQSFLSQSSKAHKSLDPLSVIATIGAVLAAAAALAGIQVRVNEFR